MVNITRRFGTMSGLDHIGVGVSDMDASVAFYAQLGFGDVAFDYLGPLPGISEVSGHSLTTARVVLIRPHHPTPLGPGSIKLVQIVDRPIPETPPLKAWGEPGICEICFHVNGQAEFHKSLVAAGQVNMMDPVSAVLDPYQTHCGLSYVADPDGAKIELIEWTDLEAGWPVEPGPQGVNHVAFGVTDIERTRDFYRHLGFTGQLFESDGYFEPMHPWYGERTPPSQHMMLLTSALGGHLEPVQHTPASPDCRGEWGQLGTYEFGIGTRSLDVAVEYLESMSIKLLGEPTSLNVGQGCTFRYAYFIEPDGLFVYLSEVRA